MENKEKPTYNFDNIKSISKRLFDYKKIIAQIPIPKKVSLPSEYAEKHIKLTRDVSPITGAYSYSHTPWWREVADRFHPKDPAKVIIAIKDGQSGCTQGVVVPVTVWTIAEDPCNIMVTSGNEVLSQEFVSTRLDPAIKSAGIMNLIRPNVIRAKNAKSGNTDYHKQFAGGNAFFTSIGAIDTVGKQKSLTKGIFDDFSASVLNDKKQGNLFQIIQQRFNTSAMTSKQGYFSTMESSPDPTYLLWEMGDQREWHMPCPYCGEFIPFKFSVESHNQNCGIIYEKDNEGNLIPESIKYKCQNCLGEFPEREKFKMQRIGKWIPMAKPKHPNWYSYKKSGLFNPAQFDGWETIIREWLDIFKDGETDTAKLKAFMTLRLGEPYEEKRESVSTNKLIINAGGYESFMIPDLRSKEVGAGKIVTITCGVDCGGNVDDARLDFEIVAWTENGQSFSIATGEIGTYHSDKKTKNNDERIKWTYELGRDNCVFDELERIVNTQFPLESDVNGYGIVVLTAIDIGWDPKRPNMEGHLEGYVTQFINLKRISAIAVKGAGDKLYVPGSDKPYYTKSKKVQGLIIVDTNYTKEEITNQQTKCWDKETGIQPYGYMNFPDIDKYYTVNGFFEQMTGEERVPEVGRGGMITGYKFVKRKGFQNHKLDARCYSFIAKEVYKDELMQKPKSRWSHFVDLILST